MKINTRPERVEVARESIDLSSTDSEEVYIEAPLSMTDAIFEVRDLVGRLIVYSEISIRPEIFAGFSNIEPVNFYLSFSL